MSSEYEKTVDALKKDVKDLRADMKGILGALHGKARDCVESAKESLQESVAHRPFVSLFAALGVGVILGGLLLRKRK